MEWLKNDLKWVWRMWVSIVIEYPQCIQMGYYIEQSDVCLSVQTFVGGRSYQLKRRSRIKVNLIWFCSLYNQCKSWNLLWSSASIYLQLISIIYVTEKLIADSDSMTQSPQNWLWKSRNFTIRRLQAFYTNATITDLSDWTFETIWCKMWPIDANCNVKSKHRTTLSQVRFDNAR